MTLAVNLAQGASNNVTFRNRIINGAMVIDQRNAGASVTVTNSAPYTLDRWWGYSAPTAKFTVQQNAGSVTPPAGFKNYLGATSSSAYSVTAADQFIIAQTIEGYNIADLGWGTASATTVTLSFWVRSSLTGTFAGSIQNNTNARSYVFSYTISSANTWEQKSITIAGDTSGTWEATNSGGLITIFSIGAGTNYNATAGAWSAGNFKSVTGATSVVGTNGATFYITGVQLEAGTTASPFEYRQYGTELALCQRYCYALRASETPSGGNYLTYGLAQAISGTYACSSIIPKVPMRTTPTLTTTGTASDYALYAGSFYTFGTVPIITGDSNPSSFNIDATSVSGVTLGFCYRFLSNNNRTSYLIFNAEL